MPSIVFDSAPVQSEWPTNTPGADNPFVPILRDSLGNDNATYSVTLTATEQAARSYVHQAATYLTETGTPVGARVKVEELSAGKVKVSVHAATRSVRTRKPKAE